MRASARIGCGLSKEPLPSAASPAVSARVKAMSLSPFTTRRMFSTEAPVASAVAL
jgi:hypothetical protein